MTEKTEALRLAEELDRGSYDAQMARTMDKAAAELRRLHQFAEDQIGRATAAEAALQMTKATHALKIAAVEAQRDALLEALRVFVSCQFPVSTEIDERGHRWTQAYLDQALPIARAVIKAVEGEKP